MPRPQAWQYLVNLAAVGKGRQQLQQWRGVGAVAEGRQQSALHQLMVEVRHVQLPQAARRLGNVSGNHVPATHKARCITMLSSFNPNSTRNYCNKNINVTI